jgi:hypothetical protein
MYSEGPGLMDQLTDLIGVEFNTLIGIVTGAFAFLSALLFYLKRTTKPQKLEANFPDIDAFLESPADDLYKN